MSVSSKARLKILSQESQSSSQGSQVNLTPATHRRNSQLFANSPLASPALANLINDDKSEKKKRLQARLSDVAQRHLGSPATERYACTPLSFRHYLSMPLYFSVNLLSLNWCECVTLSPLKVLNIYIYIYTNIFL